MKRLLLIALFAGACGQVTATMTEAELLQNLQQEPSVQSAKIHESLVFNFITKKPNVFETGDSKNLFRILQTVYEKNPNYFQHSIFGLKTMREFLQAAIDANQNTLLKQLIDDYYLKWNGDLERLALLRSKENASQKHGTSSAIVKTLNTYIEQLPTITNLDKYLDEQLEGSGLTPATIQAIKKEVRDTLGKKDAYTRLQAFDVLDAAYSKYSK